MPATMTGTKGRRGAPVPPQQRKPRLHAEETGVQLRAVDDGAALPAGVCGRIVVTALSFNEVDTYGTSFAPGCADRSIGQRVPSGRIPLLTDHENEVRQHVGVVRAMPSTGMAYLGECDVFDTEDGRRFLEYAKAVIAAGAVTGASIRFVPRAWEQVKMPDGSVMERFTEIELRELSVVPMSSVPNTDLLTARKPADGAPVDDPDDEPTPDAADLDEEDDEAEDGPDADRGADGSGAGDGDDVGLLVQACRTLLDAMPDAARTDLLKTYTETADGAPARADAATPPTPTVQTMASPDERLRAARALTV